MNTTGEPTNEIFDIGSDDNDDDIFEYYEIDSDCDSECDESITEPPNVHFITPSIRGVKMENCSQPVDTTVTYGGNTHIEMDENNQPHFDQPVRSSGVEVRQPKCEILENVVLVNGFRPFPAGFSQKHTTNKDTTSKRPFNSFKFLQKSINRIQF